MARKVKQRAPRILLYGFGPYRQFTDNITARIIKSLPRQPGLRKIIFPVRFDRRHFVEPIGTYKPDLIIGLGQSSRRTIDIESRARNWRRVARTAPRRPIAKGRPRSLATTLNLKVDQTARQSQSAGDYVCNYSMYVILDEIARKKLPVRYGFVHIPFNYGLRKAARFVANVLRCSRAHYWPSTALGLTKGAPSPT